MAFDASGRWQEEKDQDGQVPLAGAPVTKTPGGVTGPGLATSPAANGMVEQQTAPARKQASTGFVGIGDYLKANRAGAQELAGQVGGVVRASGDTARGAITAGSEAFSQGAKEGTVGYDGGAIGRVTTAFGGTPEPRVSTFAAPVTPAAPASLARPAAPAPNFIRGMAPAQTPAPAGGFSNITDFLNSNPQPVAVSQPAKPAATPAAPAVPFGGRAVQTAMGAIPGVTAGATPFRPRLVVPETTGSTAAPGANADAKPPAPPVSAADIEAIRKLTSAEYTGPTALDDTEILKSIGTAQQQAAALGTESGRKALLQDEIAKGAYTSGQGSFDQLLLGGQGQTLNAAREAATRGLEENLSSASKAALEQAAQAKATTDATRQRATEQVGALRSLFEGGIDERVQAEQTRVRNTQEQLTTRLTDALSGGADLSPAELRGMGIAPEVWVKIRDGVIQNAREMEGQGYQSKDFVKNWVAENLGGYLGGQDANLISRDTVATAEDTARQAALRQILGDEGYTAFTQSGAGGTGGAMGALDVNEEALFNDILAAQRGDFKTTHSAALDRAKKERERAAEAAAEEARKKQLGSAFGMNTGGLRF